jgi:hypothetical protein
MDSMVETIRLPELTGPTLKSTCGSGWGVGRGVWNL